MRNERRRSIPELGIGEQFVIASYNWLRELVTGFCGSVRSQAHTSFYKLCGGRLVSLSVLAKKYSLVPSRSRIWMPHRFIVRVFAYLVLL